MRFSVTVLFVEIFFVTVGIAQEARYIDLSGISQPTGESPYGSRTEGVSCVGSKELFPHQAKASLEWIEATDIYAHQQIGMEVRIENVGTVPIKVPTNPNLTDLQPTDSSTRFEYYSLCNSDTASKGPRPRAALP